MSDWIEPGQKAPDFTLADTDGNQVTLGTLRGSPVVLYFYPKDDTPGCTKEACSFRDRKDDLARLGAKLLGVSPDTVDSHVKFRDKFGLNFPLLADPEHEVAERYGAWREKTRFGKTSMGIQRSTYLIDAEGTVRKVWKNVQVDDHDGKSSRRWRSWRSDQVAGRPLSRGDRAGVAPSNHAFARLGTATSAAGRKEEPTGRNPWAL